MEQNYLQQHIMNMIVFKNLNELYKLINNYPYIPQLLIYERNGYNFLHDIVSTNDTNLTKLILKKFHGYLNNISFKEYINKRTNEGYTALHIAVLNCNYEIVSLLHKYGAESNIISYKNETALDIANKRNQSYVKIIELLNEKNPNKENNYDYNEINKIKSNLGFSYNIYKK